MRMKITVACLLTLILALMVVAPVNACKPTKVVPCGFTATTIHDLDYGISWWTCDGTILHVRGLTKYTAFFAGAPPNTVNYGFATITTYYDFNTRIGKGVFIRTWEITFVEPYFYYKPGNPAAGFPNPYGIGTLEGIEVGIATSIFYQLNGGTSLSLADFTGKLVATHGTGDFEKAKLSADTLGYPFGPPNMPPVLVRINVGNNIYEPTGKLTFYG
jgi:hypothetical protein